MAFYDYKCLEIYMDGAEKKIIYFYLFDLSFLCVSKPDTDTIN